MMTKDKPDGVGERVWARLLKQLTPDAQKEIEALDAEGLRKLIAECEENVNTSEYEEEYHVKLAELNDQIRALKGAFRDAKNYQRAKQRYAAIVLESKGR